MIVRLTEAAKDDLLEIWRYIVVDSPGAADRQLDRIEAAIARLADFPNLGVARDELREGLRMLRVDRYAVFYSYRSRRVRVERILHASRDATSIGF
ncbi:type II toxin-antitoxin system RelE/ParE family toxin [Phenylobacterium sp.]|uniref:type II toxin-antitoxin system RelE/ParE family toxin n=1 Tax=Phenylobacterium sp. TaxID=1871053 RepID=UPI0025D132B0|nr:type II toxin-antitoxin system RelE/ParE family toxin [Phenylobacterium sp.]MBX3485830.1 type II toxin-antitoxin system RelE/ParE family toxin [Phenylobacterium sp.]